MSAQHAPHDAESTPPRHDLIPEEFVPAMNAQTEARVTTVAHALRVAESLPSSTDRDHLRRCPACLSTKPRRRPDADHFACGECSATFASPLPALVDARRRADHAPDVDRASHHPRCVECASRDLYPVPASVGVVDERWVCLECAARFDTPLPSQVAAVAESAQAAREREIPPLPDDTDQTTLGEVTDG